MGRFYDSDPLYDFEAALASAENCGPGGATRIHDRLTRHDSRGSQLPEVNGLVAGRHCHRCDATFMHHDFDREDHIRWHAWRDEQFNVDEPTPADELAAFEAQNVLRPWVKPIGKVIPFKKPTEDQLRRHAELYGPEGVARTARIYSVNLNEKQLKDEKPPRLRRTTDELKRSVLDMHGRGVVAAAIADGLNLSDSRVKNIIRAAAPPVLGSDVV